MRGLWLPLVIVVAACGSSQDESAGGAGETGVGGTEAGQAGTTGGKQGVGGSIGSGGARDGGSGGTSASGGAGGAGGAGGTGGFVPPTCANPSTQLPADAPVLTPGVWTPINPAAVTYGQHGGSSDQDVFTQGMAIDPCNAASLYLTACTNPVTGTAAAVPGLYRSLNAGSTWARLGPFDGPINVRIDPKDPQHIYVGQGVRGNGIGFWVSKDGGQTWVQPQGFLDATGPLHDTDVYHVDPDPADFEHVLLSFHYYWYNGDTMGVIESFDGGESWTVHDPIPGLHGAGGYGVFILHNPSLGIGDGKTWLLGTQGAGHYRTTDAGTTWTKVTDNNMEHGGGQIYYTKTGVLFAGGIPNIMKSTDNGATWQKGGNAKTPNFGFIGIVGDGKNLYTSSHDHNVPFIMSPESDGLVWNDYSAQVSHAGAFEMAYDAANGIVYSANEYDGLLALKVTP